MDGVIRRAMLVVGAWWLLVPAIASAGHHEEKGCCQECGKVLGCYIWQLEECEETVFTVTYKEETKKVKRPIIKEIKRPVTCKACKAFDRTVLRECLVPEYKQDFKTIDNIVTTETKDDCGNCITNTEVQKSLMSCLLKSMVPIQVPVLEWELIPVETTYDETYLVQDWEDQEVVIRTPVKSPKTIKTKVWKKVPFCPDCTACSEKSHHLK